MNLLNDESFLVARANITLCFPFTPRHAWLPHQVQLLGQWKVSNPYRMQLHHRMEPSISTALNSSSKEDCTYDLDDNFDELFKMYKLKTLYWYAVICAVEPPTDREMPLNAAAMERSEGQAKGEAKSCHKPALHHSTR